MTGQAPPERTEDGRYVVVNGRRWRASDPAIPERLRQELVDELMRARGASHHGWEAPTDASRRERLEAAVLTLAVAGAVEVLQGGEPRPADADWKGPIRVRATGATPA